MQTNLETHREGNTNELNTTDPQKNILPKTQSNFNEIISTEANYEKWASFLFPQTKSKNIYWRRTKEWEAVMSDGKTTKSIIEVIPIMIATCLLPIYAHGRNQVSLTIGKSF